MWIGWGSNSSQWNMPDGNNLVAQYRYFSVMFIFKFVVQTKWLLTNNDRSQDQQLKRQEVEARYGPDAPTVGLWTRYGLIIGGVALLVAAGFSAGFQAIF